jgi:hypothetical protein
MASTTIRVSAATHARVRQLAEEGHMSLSEVVADAVAQLERRKMLEGFNADYARLKVDPKAAAEFAAEMAEFDGTLYDGLELWPYEGVDELLSRESTDVPR